jgi:hypothetical protein
MSRRQTSALSRADRGMSVRCDDDLPGADLPDLSRYALRIISDAEIDSAYSYFVPAGSAKCAGREQFWLQQAVRPAL